MFIYKQNVIRFLRKENVEELRVRRKIHRKNSYNGDIGMSSVGF